MSMKNLMVMATAAMVLAGCNSVPDRKDPRRGLVAQTPTIIAASDSVGSNHSAPVLIRVFKEEKVLELWKRTKHGTYALVKDYSICNHSGTLGPKRRQGDLQTPEGFYDVTPRQMNPFSSQYLSFNTGYPNAFDRAHGRTGGDVMVHGGCSSAGCVAIEDAPMAELYAVVRDAIRHGQSRVQLQAYPFRMTESNMSRHASNPNIQFWRDLKVGYDQFERTRQEVAWSVRSGRYQVVAK